VSDEQMTALLLVLEEHRRSLERLIEDMEREARHARRRNA
jgi:hypothetical protein